MTFAGGPRRRRRCLAAHAGWGYRARTLTPPPEHALEKSNNDLSPQRSSTAALTLLALGVVYGDIGTSPLYAVKETFAPGHGIP